MFPILIMLAISAATPCASQYRSQKMVSVAAKPVEIATREYEVRKEEEAFLFISVLWWTGNAGFSNTARESL